MSGRNGQNGRNGIPGWVITLGRFVLAPVAAFLVGLYVAQEQYASSAAQVAKNAAAITEMDKELEVLKTEIRLGFEGIDRQLVEIKERLRE